MNYNKNDELFETSRIKLIVKLIAQTQLIRVTKTVLSIVCNKR